MEGRGTFREGGGVGIFVCDVQGGGCQIFCQFSWGWEGMGWGGAERGSGNTRNTQRNISCLTDILLSLGFYLFTVGFH